MRYRSLSFNATERRLSTQTNQSKETAALLDTI